MASLIDTFGTLQQRSRVGDVSRARRRVDAADVPSELMTALRDMELLAPGDVPRAALLPSSRAVRVYRVDLGWGTICLKQALPHGDAMVDAFTSARAAAETGWFKLACSTAPGAAPVVLGSQLRRAVFATDYLDPLEFPSWDSQLASGRVDPNVATDLGHLVGRLHAASANSAVLRDRFAMQTAFHALCVEPIFRRIALEIPNQAARLTEVTEGLATTRLALVHGGLTPDNVLVGPRGPILIDADCAHYGDPMFDVASCLAALAAQMAVHPAQHEPFLASIEAFRRSYFAHLTWEIPEEADARAAQLVPALLAATLADEAFAAPGTEHARDAAHLMLGAPPSSLDGFAQDWRRALGSE